MYARVNITVHVSVVSPPDSFHCSASRPFEVTANNGYISHGENVGGTIHCPWQIKAQPGQIVNISAIDSKPQSNQGQCQSVGTIIDLLNKKETTICKNNNRKQHVYLSTGPQVKIQLDAVSQDDSFLLYFEGRSLLYENLVN